MYIDIIITMLAFAFFCARWWKKRANISRWYECWVCYSILHRAALSTILDDFVFACCSVWEPSLSHTRYYVESHLNPFWPLFFCAARCCCCSLNHVSVQQFFHRCRRVYESHILIVELSSILTAALSLRLYFFGFALNSDVVVVFSSVIKQANDVDDDQVVCCCLGNE